MQGATGADCGKECEVPFKPDGTRPVYCQECYAKRRPPFQHINARHKVRPKGREDPNKPDSGQLSAYKHLGKTKDLENLCACKSKFNRGINEWLKKNQISAQQKLSVVVSPSAISFEEIVLVIGPEGGLSTDELRELEAIGGKVVRHGTPVLRSAHAGLAGLAAVAALIKHW